MPKSLMRGRVKIERLPDGARLLTHSSGTQVVEEAEAIAKRRAALVERRERLDEQLAAHDVLADEVAALEVGSTPASLERSGEVPR